MPILPRTLDHPDRQAVIWSPQGQFTKNPDLVLMPDGRLLLVFNACDAHWPMEFSRITLLESRDRGRTWGRPRIIHEALPSRGDERWVTPRLSRLRDGRLVVICDQNDYRHKHEYQSSGIYTWWSQDEGETWDGPHPTGIPGIEPDRVVELDDGTLIVGAHYHRATTLKNTEAVYFSRDGGRTWGEQSIVASDAVHNYCEGAYLQLPSGRLVCIMRENNHNNYPSYLAFSDDRGRTWGRPIEAPFSGDRPFAGVLADGRVLVTYRNQSGRPGLYGWAGDIETDTGFKVGRGGAGPTHRVVRLHTPGELWPMNGGGVTLTPAGLTLTNAPDTVSRYLLLPPESFTSRVLFEARLSIDAPPGWPAATVQIARVGVRVTLARDLVTLEVGGRVHTVPVNWTGAHTLTLSHREGLVEVAMDGTLLHPSLVFRETLWERSYFGNDPGQRGQTTWGWVRYSVQNPTERDHTWEWSAASGELPDQYTVDRWVEIDLNTNPNPDHGYSTWTQFPDGQIFIADYSNEDAPPGKSQLKGYWVWPSDF